MTLVRVVVATNTKFAAKEPLIGIGLLGRGEIGFPICLFAAETFSSLTR